MGVIVASSRHSSEEYVTHARSLSCLAALLLAGWMLPAPLAGQRPADPEPLASFGEPAISPDRSEIAVVSGGDIWTVPAAGGEARLLVAHEATETRPIYSPTGDRLAFVSDRTGDGDIYVLTLKTGALNRVTMDDGLERLDGWSRDGKWLYFSSNSHDIAGMNDIYRVHPEGGTPLAVSADRYTSEFFAAPSPDGQTLAFSARGNSAAQWWRKGHSHLDESEIWLLRDFARGAAATYERLTDRGAKQMWPMWTSDGKGLFFVSDRSGAQNIWSLTIGGAPKQVTRFTGGRVLWPTMSYDGRTIVFERDFEVWTLDTGNGQAARIPIAKRGLAPRPAVEHVTINSQFQDLALSPDGRKVVFAARGEIWAAAARDGGDAVRVTSSYARESQIVWTPDSRSIVYVSERDDTPHLFRYDFTTSRETQVTKAATGDAAPQIAPDGKSIAFIRDGKELRAIDLASGQERVLASGHLSRSDTAVAWSPDSRWVAYVGLSAKSFRNVFVVPAAGGEPRAISAMPNGSANNIVWSPDGTYILYNTSQRTEASEVVRVDLILRTPKFREDRFRDLFKPEPAPRRDAPAPPAPAAPPGDERPTTAADRDRDREPARDPSKPVEIVFDGIRRRVSILPVGVDVASQTISPDGRLLLLTATAEGQQNLYTYSLDELAREPAVARQLTSTSGGKADAQFSPDSREVFYLEQGRLSVMPIETRQARTVAISAEMDVDFAREKIEVFRQAWRYMREGFYDDKYHGVDWNAVRAEYAPRVAGAETPADLRRLLNLMVGELNASHMGVAAGGGGRGGDGPAMGRLGLRFDRAEYEQTGKLKITEIVPLGPMAITRQVNPGDYLTSIGGTAVTGSTSIDELLAHAANRRTVLQVSAAADGSNAREIVVRPVTPATEKNLLYREWVESNRAYVDKISGGRLGYAHMNDMSEGALRRFYLDLDADNRVKDGVVIDVRNNNGGFVNVYAIDVLARRGYLMMTPRGLPTAPARSTLGQRALELPTILVTNQHSLSDAEDFTEGYRTLKLGKVVGEPTSGWIIYTGSATLVDGSTMRMPGTRITTLDGTTMELNPRPVDIPVTRPIGESLAGKDSQLDAAVRELLRQLGTARTDSSRTPGR
jgi:Tol biopolymer transport system component/C-terminal processing protease CtpA/Prc